MIQLTVYLVSSSTVIWFVVKQLWKWWRGRNEFELDYAKRGVKYVPMMTILETMLWGVQHHLLLDEAVKKEGKIFGFNAGDGTRNILVAEPELVQLVLHKEFTNFVNRRRFPVCDHIFTKFLFFMEDETWKRLRSIITPAFSTGKVKRMKPLIDDTTRTLLRNFEAAVEKNSVVDIKHLAGAFTIDTIVRTAFGVQIDSLNNEDNPLVSHARRFFGGDFNWRFVLCILMLTYAPILGRLKFLRLKRDSVLYFYESAKKIIEEKRKELERRKSENDARKACDFIELMIEAQLESKDITDDEMLAQCVLFFLAGYDTTASSITMTCYNLASNPEHQDLVYREIQDELEVLSSENPTERDPLCLITMDSLSHFSYLNAVIKETLRLYPPLVQTERRASTDIQLQTTDGAIELNLKKDDVVHIPIYTIHRDPDNHPDPESFKPERFLSEETFHNKCSYIPFGSGPRNCAARNLGYLESQLAVLHLVRCYRFSVCEQTSIPPQFFNRYNLPSPRATYLKCEPRIKS